MRVGDTVFIQGHKDPHTQVVITSIDKYATNKCITVRYTDGTTGDVPVDLLVNYLSYRYSFRELCIKPVIKVFTTMLGHFKDRLHCIQGAWWCSYCNKYHGRFIIKYKETKTAMFLTIKSVDVCAEYYTDVHDVDLWS